MFNFYLKKKIIKEINYFLKKQQRNVARAAEAVTLLNLIKTIVKRIEELTIGRIIIHTNNSKIYKMTHSLIDTANYFVQDAVAQVVMIRKRIEEATIEI